MYQNLPPAVDRRAGADPSCRASGARSAGSAWLLPVEFVSNVANHLTGSIRAVVTRAIYRKRSGRTKSIRRECDRVLKNDTDTYPAEVT
jgi:hypothetical protein